MNKEKHIHLGFEIDTGKPVDIRPSHLIVTGVTQLSGKTTTLEALIKRSELKAIVFKTKIGEKSFSEGTEVPPFFRDRSDYEFVKSLIEAYAKEKMFLEKGTLMRLCKGSSNLIEIKKKVDEELSEGKLRGIKEEIHTRLQHYLENLIPQIQYANLSKTLNIYDGINIMNIERFSEEAQSLIIQSVADEILKNYKGIILVIPEAWKFLPQKYNNPCKRVVESFIRQGAANDNYVWIDSQDMAGVDKIPLKQISTWILGFQSERNEVKHTLDQISLPKKSKPKEEDIMNLKKGHFFLSDYDGVKKIYVQPSWMNEKTAINISIGKKSVEEIEKPTSLVPYSKVTSHNGEQKSVNFDDSKIKRDIIELRNDFFNKIQDIQEMVNNIGSEIFHIKSKTNKVDTDEIVSIVLQKMPNGNNNLDRDLLIRDIISKIPKTGNVTYSVEPLEKIKQDFLVEAKEKILLDIDTLSSCQKKILKWIEQNGKRTIKKELFLNCFGRSATSGNTYTSFSDEVNKMKKLEIIRVDTQQRIFPHLKTRIRQLIEQYNATEEQINQVYNHILMEMLK